MSLGEHWFPGHLKELSEAECLELLAAHHVGRVAYCEQDSPVVLPVNYVLDGDAVLLRVDPGSALARRLGPIPASFQLDDVDPFTQSGWSVLVRGRASQVDPVDHPAAAGLRSWAEGQRTVYVLLEARQVTGRRLLEA